MCDIIKYSEYMVFFQKDFIHSTKVKRKSLVVGKQYYQHHQFAKMSGIQT